MLQGSVRLSPRCPVTPLEGPAILYEAWEGDASGTRGYAIAAGNVSAVTVDGATASLATEPITGLTVSLRAAVVSMPAPFPGFWPDEIDGVVGGLVGSPHSGWGAPPLAPSLNLPVSTWRAPGRPPAGPCELSAHALSRLKARSGRVVTTISGLQGVAGRGFMSCADTEYTLRGGSLDAAILLDSAGSGATPVPLPNSTRIRRRPGLCSAQGLRSQVLGRRIAGGWLVVEGATLAARERALAHLRARIAR